MQKYIFLIILFSLTILFSQSWERKFGMDLYNFNGRSVVQTLDSGFVIAGDNVSSPMLVPYCIWLVKTDLYGETLWTKIYNEGMAQISHSISILSDSGFILSGEEAFLLKISRYGDENWLQFYPDTGTGPGNGLFDAIQTSDGGYIAAGFDFTDISHTAGLTDAMLIKTDENGNMMWRKFYGVAYEDGATSISETSDGGYIVFGYSIHSGETGARAYVVRTDPYGNLIWQHIYGDGWDFAVGGDIVYRGGYIFTGRKADMCSDSIDYPGDVWLVRLDEDGDTIWTRTYAYTDSSDDWGWDIQETSDGGFIIVGTTQLDSLNADVYLLKTDCNGNLEWQRTFGGDGNDRGYSVKQCYDGGYIIAGTYKNTITGYSEYYIIKTDSLGEVSWISEPNIKPQNINISAYPNPFNSETRISISVPYDDHIVVNIYDISGNLVKNLYDGNIGSGIHNLKWNGIDGSGNPVSSGVYFVKINTSTKEFHTKIVLTK